MYTEKNKKPKRKWLNILHPRHNLVFGEKALFLIECYRNEVPKNNVKDQTTR